VLGVSQDRLAEFAALCQRERCPFAVVGVATAEERLVVGHGAIEYAAGSKQNAAEADAGESLSTANCELPAAGLMPIDLPMDVLFGKPPKMHRDTQRP